MADFTDTVLSFAFGMAVGGFLVSLGAYIGFQMNRRIQQPLIKVTNDFFVGLLDIFQDWNKRE